MWRHTGMGGHRRNLRVQEGLAAAPMFPIAVPVAAAGPFLQKSHAIPRSKNNRELKTAEYQRSDFKPEIQSRELHAKLLRQRRGLAAAPVGGGGHCTRYVAMHPLRGATPDQNGCNAYGSGAPHNARIPQRRVCRPARITRRQEHTKPQDPQAPPVWRAPEGSAAVPVGGGGAWPGFEPTHKHTSAHPAPQV